jgi:hypothetical protein
MLAQFTKKHKALTCIIGAYCAEGIVIVSDTRVIREFEATPETKLYKFWDEAAVIGVAGSRSISDYLIDDLHNSKPSLNITGFRDVSEGVEDSICNVRNKYFPRIGHDFDIDVIKANRSSSVYILMVYQKG